MVGVAVLVAVWVVAVVVVFCGWVLGDRREEGEVWVVALGESGLTDPAEWLGWNVLPRVERQRMERWGVLMCDVLARPAAERGWGDGVAVRELRRELMGLPVQLRGLAWRVLVAALEEEMDREVEQWQELPIFYLEQG